MDLKQRWLRLVTNYSSNQALNEQFWTEIEKAYSSKKRHYHNLQHLHYMFALGDQYQDEIEDRDTLLFSIFYHDIIYNVRRQNNEEKSAELARERLLSLNFPSEKTEKCFTQIIATKEHQSKIDHDTELLLDFDLAILGDSWEKYHAYTQNIRSEYSIYPDFLYKKGRKKVLQHFLGMERIFKTSNFYERLEERAKQNLAKELKLFS